MTLGGKIDDVTIETKNAKDGVVKGILGLAVAALLLWIGYVLSPIPQCRAIAQTLDEGAAEFYGLGLHWDAFDIANCAISSSAQRTTWTSAAEGYRFNAALFRQKMEGNQRQ